MVLKTIVKVSGVDNLSNARYCAGMGVDMIGFDMDKINIDQYKEIKNWVAGVGIVGETKSGNIIEIINNIRLFEPDLLEVSSVSIATAILEIHKIDIILKIPYPNRAEIYPVNIKYINLYSDKIDNSELEFWDINGPKLLVSNDYYLQHIENSYSNNIGISIMADQEERPGFSNFENTMDILESLEVID